MRHGFLTQGCTDPYIPRSRSHWDCHLVPLTALLAPTLGYPCSSCYTSQLADLAADCMCTSRRRRPDLAAVVRPKLEQLAQAAAAAARPADAPVPFVEPPQEYLCPISQVSEGAARVGLCPGYKQGVDLQRHQPETTTSCGHMF
jgi:hypothetical protein